MQGGLDCRIPGPPNVLLKKAATAVAHSCLTMLLPRALNCIPANSHTLGVSLTPAG